MFLLPCKKSVGTEGGIGGGDVPSPSSPCGSSTSPVGSFIIGSLPSIGLISFKDCNKSSKEK